MDGITSWGIGQIFRINPRHDALVRSRNASLFVEEADLASLTPRVSGLGKKMAGRLAVASVPASQRRRLIASVIRGPPMAKGAGEELRGHM